ncbi:MAG: type II toxin-antitoxin system RelE/ParE family toxin [Candidatus Omnitrophota bacterium]|nr:type II toxin-antitoxin system RelE/ParE family toxin [Candidatus Omnitrophota bacterium]
MAYSLKWKTEAEKEFRSLDKSIQQQAFAQFKKLANSPELGKPLGDKAGFDLTGYRKLYSFQKKYRILYELDQKNKEVIIYAIGKREDMKVYQELARRLRNT